MDDTLILPEISQKRNPNQIKPKHDYFGDYVDIDHFMLAVDDNWSEDSFEMGIIEDDKEKMAVSKAESSISKDSA